MYKLIGELHIPGDKSISHRSVMFSSLAKGSSIVRGFLPGADCLSTIACFRALGISIEQEDDCLKIHGKGLHGLRQSRELLDCGNSGTTFRLLSGILSAQNFDSRISGDASIRKRPMNRIIEPLRLMGADIESAGGYAPLHIKGSPLKAISYVSPVASAQVKSCILLAALYAEGCTSVEEPVLSRNHTELMLRQFGADIESRGNLVRLRPVDNLYACEIEVPGDISSAAFFIAAASICEGSDLILRGVGINPSRDGILRIAEKMGANIEILSLRGEHEKSADLRIRHAKLRGCVIEGDIIPSLIDELPVIAAMASIAEGETCIRDAAELKVKESNRIRVMTEELTKLGVKVRETEDGMIIQGDTSIGSALIESHGDHRIAMTFAVLGLRSTGEIRVTHPECAAISYPQFYKDLASVCR